MAKRFLFIFLGLFTCLCTVLADNTEVDSLVSLYSKRLRKEKPYNIGDLRALCYIRGTSRNAGEGFLSKYAYKVVPFQPNQDNEVAFESVEHLLYAYPGELRIVRQGLLSNNKSVADRVLDQFEQVLLPVFSLRLEDQQTSVKSFVIPFSYDGVREYRYSLKKGDECDTIYFSPKRPHYTLITGYATISKKQNGVSKLYFEGRVTLGRIKGSISFAQNNVFKWLLPDTFDAQVEYKLGKSKGINEFHCKYYWDKVISKDELKLIKDRALNLTDTTFGVNLNKELLVEDFRPDPLTARFDSIINSTYHKDTVSGSLKFSKNKMRYFEHLVDGKRVRGERDELKIYGPLNPASFGIGGIDKFWIRLRGRWRHWFNNGKYLLFKPQVGYVFRHKEIKYKAELTFQYNSRRPGGLTITAEKANSGFSSKFMDVVNAELKKKKDSISFEDLGVDFYNHYRYSISNYNELANGLSLRVGINQNYRTPVRKGVHGMTAEKRKELIDSYYADFSPFIELIWTPRSYYYYYNNEKRYVGSEYPTFKFLATRSIPDVLGTNSNFTCMELDVQQVLRLRQTRTLAYRLGTGKFFGQSEEYFIDFEYFSRGNHPSLWLDENIGGTFRMLDDYWYNSSSTYVQAHVMYETPFGLLHYVPGVSKYVIKDRLYLGALWAEGKTSYIEAGYGFGNNFFSAGLFVGLKGLNYHAIGYRIQIAIDRNLR